MNSELFIAVILTFLPLVELRAGLPVIINYCIRNNLSVGPYFLLVVLINWFVILFVFFFMDFLHNHFIKLSYYRLVMDKYIERIKRKGKRFEGKEGVWIYLALILFVAVPLPGTGAWTGSVLAWLFGFNRKKSFIAISVGVLLAGFIVLGISLGALSLFYKIF